MQYRIQTVQIPVVVVRSAAVVGLAALQRGTDLHQKGGAVLLHEGILALLRGQVRVPIFQFLGGDKGHVRGVQGASLLNIPPISFFAFQIEKSEPRENATKNRRFINNSFDVLLFLRFKVGHQMTLKITR